MNRDELLDKLAMELEEWPIDVDHAVSILPDYVGMRFPCREITHPSISPFAEYQIGEQQWFQRRTELINEPDDADAPDGFGWKCQDADGMWKFTKSRPEIATNEDGGQVDFWVADVHYCVEDGKIPAGHDWRTTLREVKRDMSENEPVMSRNEPHGITGVKHRVGRQLNPPTSSLTDSQAITVALATGVCTDGFPCDAMGRCDDCPNTPHAQDSRRLDEQLAADMRNVTTAHSILCAASRHMNDRASTYDKPQGERSMAATVDAFRATTGINLTEEQGWHFMVLLKLVRSQQGDLRLDSYEDGAAYFALAGEAAAKHR